MVSSKLDHSFRRYPAYWAPCDLSGETFESILQSCAWKAWWGAGVCVQDMHLLAEREILSKLKAGGLLKGSVDEMVDYRIGALFMPHGE